MKSREPIETVSIYLLIALIGYIFADLGIVMFRDRLLPSQPPPSRIASARRMPPPDRSVYNGITTRNIFNADQKIPPAQGASENPQSLPDAPPVPSTLPLQLMGTIVHVNPERSIATINLKSKNEQIPLKVNAVIPENLATITKIERNKVIFRNTASQRLEYIEMKDDAKLMFGAAPKIQQQGAVLKKSDTDYELKRDDINRLTSNMSDLLQQARAVPRMGPNGQIECFNMADISPGSIYEHLGLKRGDCIKSVNGQRISSPADAIRLYNELRTSGNAINLGFERGGRDELHNYNITN